MTALSQSEWDRLLQIYPQEAGELPSVWMERLWQAAAKMVEREEPSRLPYAREPGEVEK